MSVAVALAKTARERRAAPLTDEDRRLGLAPGEPPLDGLQRMALGQIDIAIEQLRRASGGTSASSAEEAGARASSGVGGRASAPASTAARGVGAGASTAVHETRKALKRLRALLRLLERELGAEVYAREDAAVRDIGRHLSGARDAQVMLDTLDSLIERHPRKLARRKGVRKLRRALLADRERLERRTLGESATLTQALAQLGALRVRVTAWRLPDSDRTRARDATWRPDRDDASRSPDRDPDAATRVERGLRDLYSQGRKPLRRARRNDGKDVHAMHRWRKRVKDLRYAAEMLERRSATKGKRRGASARLHRLAQRTDALAELLGEDHDLAVLADCVRADAKRRNRRRKKSQRVGRATRKQLLKLIARRRRKLRRRALRDGKRLYRRSPKKFARRHRR